MQGIIIKIWPEKYEIDIGNEENIFALIKGSVKRNFKTLVGDNVIIEKDSDVYIITEILKRKNSIIRPAVANIDKMVCVISNTFPTPDLLILDKQIVIAIKNNIIPVICINKSDLSISETSSYIKKVYTDAGIKVITTIAKTIQDSDTRQLEEILKDNITILSGNSGVGKSSIIKAIKNDINIEVDEVSEKIKRGKHTTKYVKLYKLENSTYIADTPGFASFDMFENIEAIDLKNYYFEFLSKKCKFANCVHTTENPADCEVRKDVISGKIDMGRYERYLQILQELKEKEKNKYK